MLRVVCLKFSYLKETRRQDLFTLLYVVCKLGREHNKGAERFLGVITKGTLPNQNQHHLQSNGNIAKESCTL